MLRAGSSAAPYYCCLGTAAWHQPPAGGGIVLGCTPLCVLFFALFVCVCVCVRVCVCVQSLWQEEPAILCPIYRLLATIRASIIITLLGCLGWCISASASRKLQHRPSPIDLPALVYRVQALCLPLGQTCDDISFQCPQADQGGGPKAQ